MTSVPLASIIRQPLGPSSNGFGASGTTSSSGPPAPDVESSLRRANTVSTPRHQVSASISSVPAATSAFHGAGKSVTGSSRFRSGSLSSSNPDPGLVRKGSGRAVRKEEAVMESTLEGHEEGVAEMSSWGKGLSRQSSLPSRRAYNPTLAPPTEEMPRKTPANPPPRPPRRISANPSSEAIPQSPPSAHSTSQSLSSLAALSPPSTYLTMDTPSYVPGGANVSRAQSLRAQAKHSDLSGLGRSSSMKAAGEHYRPMHAFSSSISPSTQPNTPHNPFTPPSPPPVSSTAAFPPFQLTGSAGQSNEGGADIKRHQSLTQGYGSSSRVRDRLERSPAVLNLQQRGDLRRPGDQGHTRTASQDQPPMSPLGHSVWSPSQGGDDGWNRPSTQSIQEAFQAMNLNIGDETRQQLDRKTPISGDQMRQPQPNPYRQNSGNSHIGDEPSWVANLVGHAERISPQPVRTASAPNWQERDPYLRAQSGQGAPGPWPNQTYLAQPFGYLPAPQSFAPGFDPRQTAIRPGTIQPGANFIQMYPGYVNQQPIPSLYPSPPVSAANPHEDVDVVALAKSKGLNPATFDCQPAQARFFVIKSYTEEDVQKSLKHEIWSSTVLGNKRLDTAFRESADKMPIYLFFSVNGSRHFCGVAQMLTPVDETQSSNVWSENNKWKGIFKVKWIFVRDIPSTAFRHIKLINTPEQKPMTNSRDTQELHHEGGCEVLQIFLDYQTKSKTSLLQDFAYYERLSANRPSSASGQRLGPPSAPASQNAFLMPTQPPQPPYAMPPPMAMPGFTSVPPVPPIPARFR